MTVRDVGELSFVELEDLIDGLTKCAEREKKAIQGGGSVEYKTADDLVAQLQTGTFDY